MADMTRMLASAIDVGFYNISGSLSGTHQTITYNISQLSYDQDTLTISALLDWNTLEFLKTFGVVFKDTFNYYLGSSVIPGWTVVNTANGSTTQSSDLRYGAVSIVNPAITDSTYAKRDIMIPRKEFATYGAGRYGANFKLYVYIDHIPEATSVWPKVSAYYIDNGGQESDRTLLAATRMTTGPTEVPLNISGEEYASRRQDYFINLRFGSYAEIINQRISAIMLFAFPANDTPTSDEIPFIAHAAVGGAKTYHDISKEGLVVSFDVSDGTTTRKYVFTGCSVSVVEQFGTADDVQASIQFKYRSMSVGEVWA